MCDGVCMNYESMTKKQLIGELEDLQQRIVELETVESNHRWKEEMLCKGEDRLRLLLENLPGYVILANLDGVIQYSYHTRYMKHTPNPRLDA